MENNTSKQKQSKYTLWDCWAAARETQDKLEELAKKGELFKK